MFLVLMIMLAVLVPALPSYACRCADEGSVAEARDSASVVFVGVTRSHYEDSDIELRERFHWEFEVERAWKGPATRHLRVYLTRADGSLGGCFFPFTVGKRYLVYAREEPGYPGRFQTSRCSRTSDVLEAETDLSELGEPIQVFH